MSNSTHYQNFTLNSTFIQKSTAPDYVRLGNRIGTAIYTIIYILGFIGNTFALITFSSRRLRYISSSVFLLVLAFSDIFALVTSIWFFLADAFAIHLQNYSALGCRFRTFFAYVFMDLSSWCIAGLAFDRYLRVRFPVESKQFCSPRNASITVLTFFLILCGINGHYFSPGIGQERGENRTTAHCLENRETYPNYYYFYKIIWPKIDMVVFCFLPACIMILCNVNIIYLRKRQRKYLENANSHRLKSKNKRKTKQTNIERNFSRNVSISKQISSHRKSMERQMSLMMAACVIVFLCTTVPVTIYLILLEEVIIKKPDFARSNGFYLFIFRMLRALMYVHFGSNFYLYCLTSRIFRAEFFQALSFRRVVPDIASRDQSLNNIALNNISDVQV